MNFKKRIRSFSLNLTFKERHLNYFYNNWDFALILKTWTRKKSSLLKADNYTSKVGRVQIELCRA
jgi:hypothetical protein